MGHLRLTVRSPGSEQRASQLQSPHPFPDLTWCISGSQHQCQPLTGDQWSHPDRTQNLLRDMWSLGRLSPPEEAVYR